jgi:hypothetical protein
MGVGVVRREVKRLELNCNYYPSASRRKPTANVTQGGVMQLQLQLKSVLVIRLPSAGASCGFCAYLAVLWASQQMQLQTNWLQLQLYIN